MLFGLTSLVALALAAAPARAGLQTPEQVNSGISSALLELRGSGLIPQYIPEDVLRLTSVLRVRYANVSLEAELGSVIARNDTLEKPVYSLNYTEAVNQTAPFNADRYTVIFADAGAAGIGFPAGQSATVRHFLGNNFEITDESGELRQVAEPITDYRPPTPPPGTAGHRYFQLVFRQPDNFQAPEGYNSPQPLVLDFVIADYLRLAGLTELVAASYFIVSGAEPTTVTVSSTASVPAGAVSSLASSVSASLAATQATTTTGASAAPTTTSGTRTSTSAAATGTSRPDGALAANSFVSAACALVVAAVAGGALL